MRIQNNESKPKIKTEKYSLGKIALHITSLAMDRYEYDVRQNPGRSKKNNGSAVITKNNQDPIKKINKFQTKTKCKIKEGANRSHLSTMNSILSSNYKNEHNHILP